jgi:hypothetical protein
VRNTERHSTFFVFIVFLGAITGSLIGDFLGTNIRSLFFLRTVYQVGMSQPMILNFKVMTITFGINFNVNLMSIIGIIVAIILVRKY